PRRIELTAYSEIQVIHVPLPVMEDIVSADPQAFRAFSTISVMSADSLIRIVHDLQKKDVSSRIASALHRMAWSTDTPITVSQDNLSIITNTSRKQVNVTIQRFIENGWVEIRYRAITVKNPEALLQFAEQKIRFG
ncbi:MAG: helix-turn-helix domain-containing protein, partial [Enterobacter ludwigii]|nr:helix-turn-helix domain-containing protein [Enterobacter ludwigii]